MPPTSRTKEEQKGLTLLALDSGRFESLNGLSQLFILDEILRTYEYDNELDDNSVKVHEVFDLIVGTGTGGLVACMVGPLDMTIQEAIEAYRFIHRSVFVEPSPGPLTVDERERRLSLALREIVQRQLGEAGLSKKFTTICPQRMIALTAMHANNLSRPMAFRTYRARTWTCSRLYYH
ncbi:hypothetical protein DL96DRAFT_234814 [Flagelloscypha sp. PMI_526]|nr:hypothetical protein DL96DRAFT_234814 [Flagelloscypha sp. PMI_526]